MRNDKKTKDEIYEKFDIQNVRFNSTGMFKTKHNRKTVLIVDKNSHLWYQLHQDEDTRTKYPYSLELTSLRIQKDCKDLNEVIDMINKYYN